MLFNSYIVRLRAELYAMSKCDGRVDYLFNTLTCRRRDLFKLVMNTLTCQSSGFLNWPHTITCVGCGSSVKYFLSVIDHSVYKTNTFTVSVVSYTA